MDFIVFACLIVLIIGLAVPVVMLYQSRFSEAAKFRRRVLVLTPGGRGGGESSDVTVRARQRLIQAKLRELEKQRTRRRDTLGHLLKQSGWSLTLVGYAFACIGAGLVFGLVLYLFGRGTILCVAGGVGGGLWLPRVILKRAINKRQTQFTHHFASALDILVRGVRTGLPISECLRIVGREVPDPVGYEFRMLVESQRVGMTTEQALARGLERMPTSDFQFFAVVLVLQQQTGGNLASTLDNLSNVLRSRKRLRDKVQSISAEAKASAMIIGALPFVVGGLLSLINPSYMALLINTNTGIVIISAGLSWMTVGIIVMHQMINFKF